MPHGRSYESISKAQRDFARGEWNQLIWSKRLCQTNHNFVMFEFMQMRIVSKSISNFAKFVKSV